MLGLAFKQDTNDIHNSPAINIVNHLIEQQVGALLHPVASEWFTKLFLPRRWSISKSEAEAIDGADVVIISTDWPQFRNVADILLAGKSAIIMDGRRLLAHRYDKLKKAGFKIIAVGSPLLTHLLHSYPQSAVYILFPIRYNNYVLS